MWLKCKRCHLSSKDLWHAHKIAVHADVDVQACCEKYVVLQKHVDACCPETMMAVAVDQCALTTRSLR